MADPLSLPKLPLNISEIVYSKERIQRAVELIKRSQGDIQFENGSAIYSSPIKRNAGHDS
jgi:hypothetical protein